jgi:hypothetical protein
MTGANGPDEVRRRTAALRYLEALAAEATAARELEAADREATAAGVTVEQLEAARSLIERAC